jgi:hypothetical protein
MTPDREALFELARKAEKTWSYNQLIALVRSLAQELETADNARDHFVRRSIALREIIADLPCLSEPPCRFFFKLSFGRHRIARASQQEHKRQKPVLRRAATAS